MTVENPRFGPPRPQKLRDHPPRSFFTAVTGKRVHRGDQYITDPQYGHGIGRPFGDLILFYYYKYDGNWDKESFKKYPTIVLEGEGKIAIVEEAKTLVKGHSVTLVFGKNGDEEVVLSISKDGVFSLRGLQ